MTPSVAGALRPQPSILVIFGGDGDLAWRKLVPSLFNLHIEKSLPEKMAIIAQTSMMRLCVNGFALA